MTHEDFRHRQKGVELAGISYQPLHIAYVDEGQGDCVLLLHGIPTWSFLWREIIPPLAAKFRVLAPDFLGHGYSDRRDCFDRSLRAQAAMICALLDRLDIERVDVVGHDTGGGVGLILGIERPERIRRLVLCNVVCYDSWPIAEMLELGNPLLKNVPAGEVLSRVRKGFTDGIHRADRQTSDFEEGILAPYGDEEGKISLIRNAVSLNTNHTMELVDRHGDIQVPTLLLWGAEDPWQRIDDGERLAREIPNSRLERVERASHWLQQDAPETVAACLLRFLE